MGIHNCSFHQFDKINTFGLVCVVLSRAFMKVSWIHRFAIDAKNHRRFFFKSSLQVWCDLGVGWNTDKYFFTLIEQKGNNLFMEKWFFIDSKYFYRFFLSRNILKARMTVAFLFGSIAAELVGCRWLEGLSQPTNKKEENKKDKTRNCPSSILDSQFLGPLR